MTNVDKIKSLLILPDYDKIDSGIELAISFNDQRIFEKLLDGCSIDFNIEGGNDHLGPGGGYRPVLNDWMQKKVIDNGKKLTSSTGYYIFLSLLLNINRETKVHDSLKLENIKELSLKKCCLERLPSNLSKLSALKTLDISFNEKLTDSKSDLSNVNQLDFLIDHGTPLKHNTDGDAWPDIFIIKYPSPEEVECNGCNENQESVEGMVSRYDGYFCSSCDQDYNNLWYYCYCCGDLVDPTINDYKIDYEKKIAEYDSLFDEEYDCKEQYRTKALVINNEIEFETICSYCEQDSRPADIEIHNILEGINNEEISQKIINNIEHKYEVDDNGLSDEQVEMISNFIEEHSP